MYLGLQDLTQDYKSQNYPDNPGSRITHTYITGSSSKAYYLQFSSLLPRVTDSAIQIQIHVITEQLGVGASCCRIPPGSRLWTLGLSN